MYAPLLTQRGSGLTPRPLTVTQEMARPSLSVVVTLLVAVPGKAMRGTCEPHPTPAWFAEKTGVWMGK